MRIKFIILALAVLISGCVKPTEYTEEPVISLISINKNVLQEGIDSLIIIFAFEDGDGDIGIESDDNSEENKNLKFYDSRVELDIPYKGYIIPKIPDQGAGNGISGEMTVTIEPKDVFCLPTLNSTSQDLTLRFQIKDRAGHFSNFVETDNITILCE